MSGGVLVASLALAILLLAVMDALLIRQNGELRSNLDHAHHALLPPAGRHAPPLLGVGPTGEAVEVAYGADPRETYVFVYSDSCGVCSETWPAWQAVARAARPTDSRLVFARLASTASPLGLKIGDDLPGVLSIAEVDPQTAFAYNMILTPEVIEVSPTGVIGRTWIGDLAGTQLASLKAAVSH
jgi:hypothetical protein